MHHGRPTIAEFEALAARLGQANFDLMVVADGSGGIATRPCGFYAASYWRETGGVAEHYGGTNGGTNHFAELTPFLVCLWQFCATHKPPSGKEVAVLCVSDSEVTVRCGNGTYGRTANLALWAMFDWYTRNGFTFWWVHVPRNSNPLNARADDRAGRVRKLFEGNAV